MEIKTAILVDGAFYRRQAKKLFGDKTPKERAVELVKYCHRHLHNGSAPKNYLYRIFYYDCPPSSKVVYNPITQKSVNFKTSPMYKWTNDFFEELSCIRKVALRIGELQDSRAGYGLTPEATKKLLSGKINTSNIKQSDLTLNIQQKGVDMRIGLDIASLAYKKQVDQIVLIAGDSDFVPAAKHARREGIDFILDPMWHSIKPSLMLHIDGKKERTGKPGSNNNDPLHK